MNYKLNPGTDKSDEQAIRLAYLIQNFVMQTLTPAEQKELDEWVEASDENMMLFEELTDEKNIEEGIAAMQQKDAEAAYQKLRGKIPFQKERSRRSIWPYAIAASFILAVAAILFFKPFDKNEAGQNGVAVIQKDIAPGSDKAILTLSDGRKVVLENAASRELINEQGVQVTKQDSGQINYTVNGIVQEMVYNTLTTPKGGQYAVTLSDGTKVWLNAASSIRYPVAFTGSDRTVELEGEAYLEVAHDASKPFHVQSRGQDITVLGTRFNVNAYGDEAVVTTSLLEGKIELRTNTQKRILKEGEQFIVDAAGQMRPNAGVNMDGVIAWRQGLFHFKDASIESILKQVSRWYDAEVVYEGEVGDLFNADMSRKLPVSKLLGILEKTGKVHFEIEGKKIIVRS